MSLTNAHVPDIEEARCCVVGGGPAGVMLGYLLARQGVTVVLLEAHKDFDREFRGDTLHPSVMEILDDLGLAGRLLELPHSKVRGGMFRTAQGPLSLASFSGLRTRYPYITLAARTSSSTSWRPRPSVSRPSAATWGPTS